MSSYYYFLFLPLLLFLLYFISRETINSLFNLLILLFEEKYVFSIISVIFLPGTIVHEISHYLTATILLLNVKEVTIFPKFQSNRIKLGGVSYEKKDFFRGFLVGVSPFFSGLYIFWLIHSLNFFPQLNVWFNIIIIYLIFAISSTMFSSKEDLKDLVFIIPIIAIFILLIYIFNIKINLLFENKIAIDHLLNFTKILNSYLLYSLIINLALLFLLKGLKFIIRK